MLPNALGLNDLLFPMTASVYYSTTSQADYGNITKKWVVDREVKCSVISNQTGDLNGELKTKGTEFIYDSNVFFRTPEDIRKQVLSNGIIKYHPLTSIAISGVKDASGELVWINGQNISNAPGAISTKYEVKTIIPTFDYNNNLRHWRVFLSKAQIQRWDQ